MLRRFVGFRRASRETNGVELESGQGLAEYGLILALIAVVCIVALQTLGLGIANSAGFTTLPMAL